MKKIAVVILNWNGAKLLEQFLPSVISFSDEATIYVADNASTDASIEVIQNQFPSVKIIQNTGNFGFAKGYNEALKFERYFFISSFENERNKGKSKSNSFFSSFVTKSNASIEFPAELPFKKFANNRCRKKPNFSISACIKSRFSMVNLNILEVLSRKHIFRF